MFNFWIWKICGFHLNLWSYQFWLVVWVENLLDACSAIQCAQHIITTLNNNDEQATVGNSYREPWSRNGANERNCFALDIFAFFPFIFRNFFLFLLLYTHIFRALFWTHFKGSFLSFFVFFVLTLLRFNIYTIIYLFGWDVHVRRHQFLFIVRMRRSICLKIRLI